MLHALAAERSTRDVWWLHGARDGSAHAFAAESRTLLRLGMTVRTAEDSLAAIFPPSAS
jgi:ferredoxin-NADP reductase